MTIGILDELVAEFVEERVRQFPTRSFGVTDIVRALATALGDAGQTELTTKDHQKIARLLDEHPFLVRTLSGTGATWRPGLAKRQGL